MQAPIMQAKVRKIREIESRQSPVHLASSFVSTRQLSMEIIEPLSEEDCQIQSMPDASPSKWHLAHTSWFFETFILKKFVQGYQSFNPHYEELFNSYYNAVGKQFNRPQRGMLSRPSLSEIVQYRQHVEAAIQKFVPSDGCTIAALELLEIGIQHEKQHQELMLTDIQHGLFQNSILPAYASDIQAQESNAAPMSWIEFEGGLKEIGAGTEGYAFDNERPQHSYYLKPFKLASRTVTNTEYLDFIQSGGYRESQHWLADGWAWVQESNVDSPLYWRCSGENKDQWYQFGLAGEVPLNGEQPVCHLNYFEASAYAAWAGKRLPTEFEWEHASAKSQDSPSYLDLSKLRPEIASRAGLTQMFGNIWEWTSSSYSAYPGFQPFGGDAGEYNGKFMSGQFVLRGGSCVSPENHIRASYRNFFYPHQSWQYSGIRLAEDIDE